MKALARILFSMIAVLVIAAPLNVCAEDDYEEVEVDIKPYDLITVSSDLLRRYNNEKLSRIFFNNDWNPSETYTTLAEVATAYQTSLDDLRAGNAKLTLHFTSNSVISELGSVDISALETLFNAGALISINTSDGTVLRDILGMGESIILFNAYAPEDSWHYLLYRGEELLLPTNNLSFQELMEASIDWTAEIDVDIEEMGAVLKERAASESAWILIQQEDIRDRLDSGNEGRWSIEIFKLEKPPLNDKKDWYRFDFILTSRPEFKKCKEYGPLYECGWYTVSTDFNVKLNDATLYKHIPQPSNQEHTQTISIGIGSGGVNASYSKTYSYTDVTIDTLGTSQVDNRVVWHSKFKKPDFFWLPSVTFVRTTNESYDWEPSMVASVPKCEGLECVKPKICITAEIAYKKLYGKREPLSGYRFDFSSQRFLSEKCYIFGDDGLHNDF
ncbi:hypothetical protein G3480_04160 [Thiorhodococcus mannitoliphagus]|uniref:Uncharacterized protein n=1 Tax=Thiorhodococcus mannitoliphagus TaxID=329406 RepID=A0A6P1DQT1_9GAMM|nr:hypothetical protein [Thiorhodococcus mannitoliphagus]NEX19513.1 hypothetical protein [Thiorhodococcus mannitoliphagus]